LISAGHQHMLSIVCSHALAFAPLTVPRASAPVMETKADLVTLAKELNPVVGFWDPLGLADGEFWGDSNEATIGFLRHAELKHGRVAMAGFVGYCVHATGFHWPWPMSGGGLGGQFPGQLYEEGSHLVPNPSWFPAYNGGEWPTLQNGDVPALWDQMSDPAKWQILLAVLFLELWGESMGTHYMRGGRPGEYPSFEGAYEGGMLPHPVPIKSLWDPFGFTKKMSPEKKAKSLKAEINNGRLAMIGLFGFMAESAVPGAVPGLTGTIPQSSSLAIQMQPFTHSQWW